MSKLFVLCSILVAGVSASSAHAGRAPLCRDLSADQAKKLVAFISRSQGYATCSNYDAPKQNGRPTRACKANSFFGSAVEESPMPCFVHEKNSWTPIWFATDTPDLHYVWTRFGSNAYFTSLGAVVGCQGALSPRMVPFLSPTAPADEDGQVNLIPARDAASIVDSVDSSAVDLTTYACPF